VAPFIGTLSLSAWPMTGKWKRQLIVVNRCCLCKLNGESVDHLLFHCEVACSLWNAIFSRFGLSWVTPNSVKDLFACWWPGGNSQSAVFWKMVPLCIMWCLWRERNDRSFENLERTLEELKSFFLLILLFGFFPLYLDNCLFKRSSNLSFFLFFFFPSLLGQLLI
jgi:hypothetical protein